MAYLPETSQALAELRTEVAKGYGSHFANETNVAITGMPISQEPFTSAYDISTIDPTSEMEYMTGGWPHVTRRIPYRSLPTAVFLHQDPAERFLKQWLHPVRAQKRFLALAIHEALVESMQRADEPSQHLVGDINLSPELYVVGETTSFSLQGIETEAEAIEGTEDGKAAADAIAERSAGKLAFVISDYENLPLTETESPAVAVRANHEFEVEAPYIERPRIRMPVRGSSRTVRLWKKDEVDAFNGELAAGNAGIDSPLEARGFYVAHAVIKQTVDYGPIDHEIAACVRQVELG